MWQDSMKCDSTYINIQFHFLLVHSFEFVLNFHTAKMSERRCWYEDHDGHILTWLVAMWRDLLMCDSTRLSLSEPKVQYVAVCCSVLQCVAVCSLICDTTDLSLSEPKVQCVAVCSLICNSTDLSLSEPKVQCVAVCCGVLQCVAVCCSVLQCVAVCSLICNSTDLSLRTKRAVCCSVLRCVAQCVAVCCSVLQCAHWYVTRLIHILITFRAPASARRSRRVLTHIQRLERGGEACGYRLAGWCE